MCHAMRMFPNLLQNHHTIQSYRSTYLETSENKLNISPLFMDTVKLQYLLHKNPTTFAIPGNTNPFHSFTSRVLTSWDTNEL